MNKEFVPYDIALAMKELGFDNVNCLGVYYGEFDYDEKSWGLSEVDEENEDHFIYNHRSSQKEAQKGFKDGVLAPLYQQAFRWFRDEYNIDVCVLPKFDGNYGAECFENGSLLPVELLGKFSYEEAQDACLRKLIENISHRTYIGSL